MEVVVEGRAIAYDLAGSAPDTIMFLPALGTTQRMWAPQLDHFSRHLTVVAPNLAGHEVVIDHLSLDELARLATAVLDAIGAVRAHLVGISLGGMVAQKVALRSPDRVLSMALVN